MIPQEYEQKFKLLNDEAEKIQLFAQSCPTDDANVLVDRLTDLNHYMARTAVMLAEAKMIQDKSQLDAYLAYDFDGMPASAVNKMVASMCGEANMLVNWIDRLNRTLVHIGENMRTQISFSKEQLKLTRSGY